MPQDKNGAELKVGDTVRFEGVIQESVYSAGDEVLASGPSGQRFYFLTSGIEFVSRPEPTVSVELTRDELTRLRTGVTHEWEGALYYKINDLVNQLDDEARNA